MDRPTFLTTCRRHALAIALGESRVSLRCLELSEARDEAIFRAGKLGVAGAELCWIDGLREAVLPPGLYTGISEAFGIASPPELLDDFTAHQRIRLLAELRHLEASICSTPEAAPIS